MRANLLALALIFAPASLGAQDYHCKTVDSDWRWFSDHGALYIKYVVVGAPGRSYDVGTGISIAGKPRGAISTYSGPVEVTAYGLGALHVRRADEGEPFKVCATSKKVKPIKIIEVEF